MPLTFFLDLLRHQELIPFNTGGIVAPDDSHCILELVGNFSWRNKQPVVNKGQGIQEALCPDVDQQPCF